MAVGATVFIRPLIHKKLFHKGFNSALNNSSNLQQNERRRCNTLIHSYANNVQLMSTLTHGRVCLLTNSLAWHWKFAFMTRYDHESSTRTLSTNCAAYQSHRNDPDGEHRNETLSYQLMEFPQIVWPSVIYTVKNWILMMLIIKPYLDKEFTFESFIRGAKQAMVHVSSLLSQGQLSALSGLVTDQAMSEIEKNYSRLTLSQRRELAVAEDDVYFLYPYQVGIMLDDSGGVQRRLVEITVCFHCLLDSTEVRRIATTMREMTNHKDKILIVNYRFIKEFTKGRESDWTINIVNYFKPVFPL